MMKSPNDPKGPLTSWNSASLHCSIPNPAFSARVISDRTVFPRRNSNDWLQLICGKIMQDLEAYGLCVLDGFLGDEKASLILHDVITLHEKGLLREGQLVYGKSETQKRIRGDFITWVNGKDDGGYYIGYFLSIIDSMILTCNQFSENFAQKNIHGRTKAMVSCYPGNGTSYVKHVDNPNKDGRCVTVIYYLNKNWNTKEHGGLLRIFPENWDSQVADVEPHFDRLLLFWSDRRNPHEVQPAYRIRYAITTWFLNEEEWKQAHTHTNR